MHAQVADAFHDGAVGAGQKAGAHAVGDGAKAQIKAGGLNLPRWDRPGRRDAAAMDQLGDGLGRQYAGPVAGRRWAGLGFCNGGGFRQGCVLREKWDQSMTSDNSIEALAAAYAIFTKGWNKSEQAYTRTCSPGPGAPSYDLGDCPLGGGSQIPRTT